MSECEEAMVGKNGLENDRADIYLGTSATNADRNSSSAYARSLPSAISRCEE